MSENWSAPDSIDHNISGPRRQQTHHAIPRVDTFTLPGPRPLSPTITPPTPLEKSEATGELFLFPGHARHFNAQKPHSLTWSSGMPSAKPNWTQKIAQGLPSLVTSETRGLAKREDVRYPTPPLAIQRRIVKMYETLRAEDDQEKLRDTFNLDSEWEDSTKQTPSIDDIVNMFFSMNAGNAVAALPEKDLTLPITHYFINSSHNTYLEGHQWMSLCTPDAYAKVLQRGCRCVEIDVWNGDVDRGFRGERLPQMAASLFGSHTKFNSASNSQSGDCSSNHSRTTSNISTPSTDQNIPSPSSPGKRKKANDVSTSRDKCHTRGTSNASLSAGSTSSSLGARPGVREPLVMHGWTICPPCGFREVCRAIADNAFLNGNSLPLIVSLEVHTDPGQQELMVQIMHEEWGDMLLSAPLDGCDPRFRVPRLCDLQHKILVKVKKHRGSRSLGSAGEMVERLRAISGQALERLTPEVRSRRRSSDGRVGLYNPTTGHERSMSHESINSQASSIACGTSLYSDSESNISGIEESFEGTSSTTPSNNVNFDNEDDDFSPHLVQGISLARVEAAEKRASMPIKNKKKNASVGGSGIVEVLGKLAVYTHGERFKKFDSPATKTPTHIFSISEAKIPELYASAPATVFAHNKQYFMRAYPNVKRIGSSNPDPAIFWRKGVQMVAMNWQCNDSPMMINHAMFADEDGWTIKPPGFRYTNKLTRTHLDACVWKTMDLRIILHAGYSVEGSEQGLDAAESTKVIEPVVVVTVHAEGQNKALEKESDGVKDTGGKNASSYSQRSVPAQSRNPDWGLAGCVLEFERIPRVTDKLSYLRFTVEDSSLLGQNMLFSWQCIRLDRLRTGFRFIPLMNKKAEQCGYLLVTIEMSCQEIPRPKTMWKPSGS
ncbi:uncharacterized protein BROUX77_007250 [Berkeleyomyces rouxiae]|uniref:uncharacterized protein n=1 Tax=Berkeleyomyces rouxiae TaxID=2035830 RepID=UPI003B7B5417